jgi:DmsE family decaheme c-type cytochrome
MAIPGTKSVPAGAWRTAWRLLLLALILTAFGRAAAQVGPPVTGPSAAPPGNAASAARSATPAPLPAGSVNDDQCGICHSLEREQFMHTLHAKVFRINPRNGTERFYCQSCHGPGERHMQNPTDKTVMVNFTRKGSTPVDVQNNQCMTCHQGKQRIFWGGSAHQRQQVACSDCHNPMARFSDNGLERKSSISETCYGCHQQQRTEFMKRSHMPLPEGKMTCTDCHNPHGTSTRPLLKADSVNQLCYACHQEKRGPFLHEHAPVRQNCMNCHQAHGSNNDSLLSVARPFLCQQCHSQILHPNDLLTRGNLPTATGNQARPDPRAMNRGCVNCHSQVHGSNHPSGPRFQR